MGGRRALQVSGGARCEGGHVGEEVGQLHWDQQCICIAHKHLCARKCTKVQGFKIDADPHC